MCAITNIPLSLSCGSNYTRERSVIAIPVREMSENQLRHRETANRNSVYDLNVIAYILDSSRSYQEMTLSPYDA